MTLLFESLSLQARDLYSQVKNLPIVSPHGHTDPSWWAEDDCFPDPATLLIVPDHYVLRMLYSQGVPLEKLGVGVPVEQRDARKIFQIFSDHWHLFLGTPSRQWIEHTLSQTLNISTELTPENSDKIFDEIAEKLQTNAFRPRAMFDRFNIEILATTDAATDNLQHHIEIAESDWKGRVIPTFRPDSILNPSRSDYASSIGRLAELTNLDVANYGKFLEAIRHRRSFFQQHGATATDHDVPDLSTEWLARDVVEHLHGLADKGEISERDAVRYYGHMLVEMAQMSAEDGLVMQIHAGSTRNTNSEVFHRFGPDMGADIPKAVDWVSGLSGLLNRVGNNPKFRLLAFTLDESTYSRELAPMAGHWPCMLLGPPWWFHDSLNGMTRYFDQVVETAGYFNLAGFNDDTRAFLSIPARHDLWRIAVAKHLATNIEIGRLNISDAEFLANRLSYDAAKEAYRLDEKRD